LQAIEKIEISTNWVTLTFMGLLFCVFLLKGFHATKLKEYGTAFFNKGFIISEIEERASILKRFSFVLFSFTTLVFALLIFFAINYFTNQTLLDASFFGIIIGGVFLYFILKRSLEYVFVILFSIQTHTIFFLTAKKIYTHTLSLWIFPILILFFYTEFNKMTLLTLIALLFVVKIMLLFIHNKNLILSKLFYIILYLCAFEIAPLFILFKWMF